MVETCVFTLEYKPVQACQRRHRDHQQLLRGWRMACKARSRRLPEADAGARCEAAAPRAARFMARCLIAASLRNRCASSALGAFGSGACVLGVPNTACTVATTGVAAA